METALPFTNELPLFMRLEKIAEYSNMSAKQQMQYDDSYNNYLAYMGAQEYKMNEGIRIGEAKGRAEGRAEGAQSNAIATARKMKSKGYSLDEIAELTGLPLTQIQSL